MPVNYQNIVIIPFRLEISTIIIELFRRLNLALLRHSRLMVAQLYIFLNNGVDVKFPIGHISIEIRALLKSHLFDKDINKRFIYLNLTILEPTLKHFSGEKSLFSLSLLERQLDLGFCLWRLYDTQPTGLGPLIVLRQNLYRYRYVSAQSQTIERLAEYAKVQWI